MSNRSSKKRKPKPRRTARGIATLHWPWWKIVSSIVGFAVTIVSLIAALVTFTPRMMATASDPVDPNNPFSASVFIQNVGNVPVDSVNVSVAPDRIDTIGQQRQIQLESQSRFGVRLHNMRWGKPDLAAGKGFHIALDDVLTIPTANLQAASLAVIVDYEIPLLHKKREVIFPMYARRQTNGSYHWYEKALSQ